MAYSRRSLLLLLLLQVLLATTTLSSSDNLPETGNDVVVEVNRSQREFDYFALALQWPGTYCRGTRHCCSKNACCRQGSDAPTQFTIHGLWPDYNDGSWPSCCYRSDFNEKEISTLIDGMEKYWPSLSCGSPSSCHGGKGSFWGHEKHGTCSSPVFRDEYSYFVTTLNIYLKHNVTDVLYKAGYVASNSEKYPLGGIVTAIQNAFHINPEVVCKRDAIDEIRLCFYKDFKPRDCLGSKDLTSRKSCPKYVSLPEYTPLDGEAMVLKMPTDE
ncbi:hypothetical protein Bca52824_093693 [Brassica carinata]|uniref:Uncharacterized protein n=1 Tax=Brassica carinata TaxID=52824 RepID=A0A8X7P5S3_BRACI|nr:hypothetical protein Bca52824_093688 [Brassica carinata]KAG2244468.1 hypothetical protein Bca52824_093693 [Brassica carinata]